MKTHSNQALLMLLFFCIVLGFQAQALVLDSNLPDSLRKLIESDLDYLKHIQGKASSPYNKEFFGEDPVDGLNYFKYFSLNVESIGFDDSINSNGVAYAAVFNGRRSKIWLTQDYVKKNFPPIIRLSILMHEARHCESNSSWLHANCPNPYLDEKGSEILNSHGKPLSGKTRLCDFNELGSYGLQTVFLNNIAKYCTNCSSEDKKLAEVWREDSLKRIIEPKSSFLRALPMILNQ